MISNKGDRVLKKRICIGLILFLCTSFTGCNNDVVAKVNDIEINVEQYKKIGTILSALGSYDNKDLKDIDQSLLSFIIDNEVVYQAAIKEGYKVSTSEVNKEYEMVKLTLKDNLDNKNNKIDDEFIKSQMEKDVMINKYKQEYLKEISITDKEIKEYYDNNKSKFQREELRASQILISTFNDNNEPVSDEEKDKLKEKANEILNKINSKKESFEYMAMTYSDDKSSGKKGGDLGYFSKEDKNSKFTKEVFRLKENEVSEVFETVYGYHIVKVIDKKIVEKNFNEAEAEIKNILKNQKYIEHVDSLYKEAKITIT